MDKNFVDIDNLVRQRLAGGEQQERSGAWTNMRELLDKEMPQERPVGGFYWRRIFSAAALLLLVGTVGVGGYKIANSVSDNTRNADGTVASVSAGATPSSNGVIAHNSEGNNPIVASGASEDLEPNNKGNKETNAKQLIAANENHITNRDINKQIPVTNTAINDQANNKVATNDKHTNIQAATTNMPVSAGNTVVKNSIAVNNNNEKVDKRAGVPAANQTSKDALATGNTVNNGKASSAPAVAKTTAPAKNNTTVAGTDRAAKHADKTATAVADVAGRNNTAEKANTNNNSKKAAGNTGYASKNTPAGNSKATSAPVATANSGKAVAAKNNVAAKRTNKTDKTSVTETNKIALSSHGPSAKSATGISANVIGNKVAPVTENKIPGTNGTVNTGKSVGSTNVTGERSVPVFVTKSGKRIPGDKLQKLNMDKAKLNKTDNVAASVNMLKSKRVIQKMALVEHFIKTNTSGEGFYKLDTVSVVTLTEELGIITETKTTVPANSKKSGGANSSENNKGIADPQADHDTAPTKSKAKKHAKEKDKVTSGGTMAMANGAMTMENLSAAFNDVKNNVAGMQFAPGLVAGINATFFGPNSFKGFQFGFAGNFIFNDKVSVMTELKYFHRINNNYELSDNYYTYTPANGGYSKELQLNSYSFSTLHSFEMPIALRFTQSHFNFFAGANIVYSFSINTGAASQADPNNTSTATAIGNDNAPKLKVQDFSSRLGLGYLFGASYNVSRNVTLDFRNVQTVWDNSKSAGAKAISSQLYKSPSLQLSFAYRLGGGRKD